MNPRLHKFFMTLKQPFFSRVLRNNTSHVRFDGGEDDDGDDDEDDDDDQYHHSVSSFRISIPYHHSVSFRIIIPYHSVSSIER